MLHELLVCAMLLTGSAFMLFASLGLVRFGDALCRAHALSKATTFGICLLLMALWVAISEDVSRLKLVLVLSFSLLTIPVASHLVALLMHRQKMGIDTDDDDRKDEPDPR